MNGANRLEHEASPYLRQHADNPVDWYPWGDEAFARARALDRPILLSIGYASCHWCHVMARESFSDQQVAQLMNRLFVNIKVDREERPDVDAVYMSAVQALTGQGGWPLTVALTPDLRPFFGGTYYPPLDRHGAPSFTRVLLAVADAWKQRKEQVQEAAAELTQALQRTQRPLGGGANQPTAPEMLDELLRSLVLSEDKQHGGFGGAPKFPPHELLRLLLSRPEDDAQQLALRTLRAMAKGGIHDQLGGAFARYSVDVAWRVPHFEMMLYDNAAMLRNYATAYSRSGDPQLRAVADGVAEWAVQQLGFEPGSGGALAGGHVPPEVGFFSALDADQQGHEGAYYLWSEADFRQAAGDDADLAAQRFGVTTPGAFEGLNVLYRARPVTELARLHRLPPTEVEARLEAVRRRLLAARAQRPRPAVDDKALASWNGLMLGALATAGRLLAQPRLLQLASANALFLRRQLWADGRLWHMWRQDQRSVEGLLEDYAYVGLGLLQLYRATFEPWHLRWALQLADAVSERFHDQQGGGYFSTAADMQRLLVRPKGYVDASTPSENAAAAELVWWAARYRDDQPRQRQAEAALNGVGAALQQAPQALASSLRSLLLMQAEPRETVFAGAPGRPALEELQARWRRYDDDSALLLLLDGADDWRSQLPLAQGRQPDPAKPEVATGYVCVGGRCHLPARDPELFERQLQQAGWRSATSSPAD